MKTVEAKPVALTRGRELRLLGRMVLPRRLDTPRGPVSGAALVAVLRAIDDYGHSPERDQPLTLKAARDDQGTLQPGLAERIGRGVSTVRRAISGLERLGLLNVEPHWDRHGRRRNSYTIVWSRVDAWLAEQTGGGVDVDRWMEHIAHDDASEQENPGQRDDPDAAQDEPVPDVTVMSSDVPDEVSPESTMTVPSSLRAHLSPPPPPSPKPAPAEEGDAWEAVAAAMVQLGIESVAPAIDAARRRGVSADHLLLLVEHFRRRADEHGWGAAALRTRIRDATPGVPVEAAWPPASRQARRQRDQQARLAAARAAHQQAQALRARRDAEAAAIEQQFGPRWSAMSGCEQRSLAATVGPYLSAALRRYGPNDRRVRGPALRELARREEAARS